MEDIAQERPAAPTDRPKPRWRRVLGTGATGLVLLVLAFGAVMAVVDQDVCHPMTDQAPGSLAASCSSTKYTTVSTAMVRDVPPGQPVRLVAVFSKKTTRPGRPARPQPGPDGVLEVRLHHPDNWGELREIRWE